MPGVFAGRRALAGVALALLIGLLPVPALAADASAFRYDIRLDAPQAVEALLTTNLDLYRWRDDAEMDAAQLQQLLARLPDQARELLETEGYYGAQVSAELRTEGTVPVVSLAVEPGEPTRVGEVDLGLTGAAGDDAAAHAQLLKALRRAWGLRRGAVFRHADWEKAKRGLLTPLLAERYPAARIRESRATIDPARREASLKVLIDSGPAYRFGDMSIEGLQRYPPSVVARLNPIRVGEDYAQSKLLAFQAALRDSPYFATVSVTAELDLPGDGGENEQRAPILVRVEEQPASKLGFGAGLSTDAGPRGSVQYSDLNLLDRAWRLKTALTLDAKRQTLAGEFALPQAASGHRDSVHAKLERTDVEEQVTRAWNLGAKRTHVHGDIETVVGLDYIHELEEVAGVPDAINQALIASYSWTRRAVDDLLVPRRGYLVNLQAGGGSQILASDQDFLRGYARLTWFQPLGKRDTLILRSELGAVLADSRQGIPADLLFRAGGDQSVRGYAYQSLGVAEGDAIVGGRWLVTASAEYIHWLRPKWGAAVFCDLGDAADAPADLTLNAGYGLGARWRSPVGLLGLDVAYGEATDEVRLHFSATVGF